MHSLLHFIATPRSLAASTKKMVSAASFSVGNIMNPPKPKPLPLKQRTSSVDQRRDFNMQTWVSVIGLLKLREFVITVDHFSIWRRHLAWAVENGKDLREYMTQRYASSMVFMSLLLATELNVLFNSARVTTNVRDALMHEAYRDIHFWAGIAVIISAILTLLSLISIFTAWTSTYTNNAIELRLETVCFGLNFTCTHYSR